MQTLIEIIRTCRFWHRTVPAKNTKFYRMHRIQNELMIRNVSNVSTISQFNFCASNDIDTDAPRKTITVNKIKYWHCSLVSTVTVTA